MKKQLFFVSQGFAKVGSPEASHIKASQPHFLHFPCFGVLMLALGHLLRPFFFPGRERPSAFPAFVLYRVRIADFENPTDRLYLDRP